MNGKRSGRESSEIFAKKARLTEEFTNDEIALNHSQESSVEYEAEVPQSHGEPTFAAITHDDGVTGHDYSDLSSEFLDDFECTAEQNRQPVAGPMGWITQQIEFGTDPRQLLKQMLPANIEIPSNMDIFMIWKSIFDILTDPQPRQKLSSVNTIDDALYLLRNCRNIVILTGAGVSVSCGIPDFRSRDGIYARLSKEYPDLPDPQAMFDITYFRHNIKPFYKFAKEIYPGKFKPSLSHRFINQIEKHGQLLRNYTQNIDTLEKQAGITRAVECHGSFSTASCTNCKYKVTADVIKEDILNQVTPLCPLCLVSEDILTVMKPDIVFFGESLPQYFHKCIEQDINQADLLIVIGSSLKVRPVALIPNQIPANVPQILINREPLPQLNFDVELLGDCDTIIGYLCQELGETWLDVLEDFTVPKVPAQRVPEFLETSPSSADQNALKYDCVTRGVMDETTGENIDKFNMDLKHCSEEQDLTYVHLPPCRYIFHGAELKRRKHIASFSDGTSSDRDSSEDTSSDGSRESSEENNDELNNDNLDFDCKPTFDLDEDSIVSH